MQSAASASPPVALDLDSYISQFILSQKPAPTSRSALIAVIQATPVTPPHTFRRATVVQRTIELLDADRLPIRFPRQKGRGGSGGGLGGGEEDYGEEGCAACACGCDVSASTTPTGTPRLAGGGGEGGYEAIGDGGGGIGVGSSRFLINGRLHHLRHHHNHHHHHHSCVRSSSICTTLSDPKSSCSSSTPTTNGTGTGTCTTASTFGGRYNAHSGSLTLPYQLQYNILAPLLHLLEAACYRWALAHVPHILHERGWDSGECAPFTEWLRALEFDHDPAVWDTLEPVKESVDKRCKLTSEAIIKALETVEVLAERMKDRGLEREVGKLRRCVAEAVEAVKRVDAVAREAERAELEDARRMWEEARAKAEARREDRIRSVVGGQVTELGKVVGEWCGRAPFSTVRMTVALQSDDEDDDDDGDQDMEEEEEEEEEDIEEQYYDTDDKMDGT